MAVDLGVAALATILGLTELFGDDIIVARDPDLLAVALTLTGGFALIWRRSAPITVLAVAVGVLTIVYIRDYGTFLSSIGLTAIYAVALHSEERRRAWGAVVAATAVLFLVASFTIIDGEHGYSIANAASMLLSLFGVAVGGVVMRHRHEIFLNTEARADRAEADRALAAERAVATERLRIAREMHDVVAHGMSVIAVQAAAAQEAFETQPDRTKDLLHSIETTGRESLSEMRRMLAVLRHGEDGPAASESQLEPQPSLQDLDKLVAKSVDAGTPTDLEIAGDAVRLAPGIELAAYRIVQEALTNVRKHGGTAVEVSVDVLYAENELCLTITDSGRGLVSNEHPAGSGNGLIGMRERVDAYGGRLSAGPRLGGGYEVMACLPTSSQGRPRVDSSEQVKKGTP